VTLADIYEAEQQLLAALRWNGADVWMHLQDLANRYRPQLGPTETTPGPVPQVFDDPSLYGRTTATSERIDDDGDTTAAG
jgi:hypothetical protein